MTRLCNRPRASLIRRRSLYMGELVEFGATAKIFTNPAQKRTEDYVSGRFG